MWYERRRPVPRLLSAQLFPSWGTVSSSTFRKLPSYSVRLGSNATLWPHRTGLTPWTRRFLIHQALGLWAAPGQGPRAECPRGGGGCLLTERTAVTKGTRKQSSPRTQGRGYTVLWPGVGSLALGSAVPLMKQNLRELESRHWLHPLPPAWGGELGEATQELCLPPWAGHSCPALPRGQVWHPFGCTDPFRKGSHLQTPWSFYRPTVVAQDDSLLGCRLPLVGGGEEVSVGWEGLAGCLQPYDQGTAPRPWGRLGRRVPRCSSPGAWEGLQTKPWASTRF